MQNWGLLILVIVFFVAYLPAMMKLWRTDRLRFIKTLWLTAIYALYITLGALLVLLAPSRGGMGLLLTGVMVGWILYGALTLVRGGAASPRGAKLADAVPASPISSCSVSWLAALAPICGLDECSLIVLAAWAGIGAAGPR